MSEQDEIKIKKAFLNFLDTEIKFSYPTKEEKEERRLFLVDVLYHIHLKLINKDNPEKLPTHI